VPASASLYMGVCNYLDVPAKDFLRNSSQGHLAGQTCWVGDELTAYRAGRLVERATRAFSAPPATPPGRVVDGLKLGQLDGLKLGQLGMERHPDLFAPAIAAHVKPGYRYLQHGVPFLRGG
jgi:hypothetical protein